jgi:hypothetical protein
VDLWSDTTCFHLIQLVQVLCTYLSTPRAVPDEHRAPSTLHDASTNCFRQRAVHVERAVYAVYVVCVVCAEHAVHAVYVAVYAVCTTCAVHAVCAAHAVYETHMLCTKPGVHGGIYIYIYIYIYNIHISIHIYIYIYTYVSFRLKAPTTKKVKEFA